MSDLLILREILGWCVVFNISVMLVIVTMLRVKGDAIRALHARMFGVAEAELPGAHYRFLAQYKIATLVFSVVPYFALGMVA